VSRLAKSDVLKVGGEPRVDLLPPELLAQRNAAVNRRRLGLGVVLVIAVVLGGVVLASFQALQAQANLAVEQSRAQTLLVQQKKYVEVRKVQDEVSSLKAAQQVGTSTEIDWKNYLTAVQATLPANVTIDIVTIDSATPLLPYGQSTVPLQGVRVATLSFTANSPTLPEVPAWLDSLASLPGFTDASPGSVTRDASGNYTVDITMHINQAAFSKRYAAQGK
jgi:Tfp pilus assembly protein PilN